MIAYRIKPDSGEGLPFTFGGDRAYVEEWPNNPEGQPLVLLFSIDCKAARQRLKRNDLPEAGIIHVFSTYAKDDYFLDALTVDEVQQHKVSAAYTRVLHSLREESIQAPGLSIPVRAADFAETHVSDHEFCVASLVSALPPKGAVIPEALMSGYNFFCQVYSSDFPEPFQDALYLSDALGYLLINPSPDAEKVDGCFFVQVA